MENDHRNKKQSRDQKTTKKKNNQKIRKSSSQEQIPFPKSNKNREHYNFSMKDIPLKLLHSKSIEVEHQPDIYVLGNINLNKYIKYFRSKLIKNFIKRISTKDDLDSDIESIQEDKLSQDQNIDQSMDQLLRFDSVQNIKTKNQEKKMFDELKQSETFQDIEKSQITRASNEMKKAVKIQDIFNCLIYLSAALENQTDFKILFNSNHNNYVSYYQKNQDIKIQMKLISKNFQVREDVIKFALDFQEDYLLQFVFQQIKDYEDFSQRKYLKIFTQRKCLEKILLKYKLEGFKKQKINIRFYMLSELIFKNLFDTQQKIYLFKLLHEKYEFGVNKMFHQCLVKKNDDICIFMQTKFQILIQQDIYDLLVSHKLYPLILHQNGKILEDIVLNKKRFNIISTDLSKGLYIYQIALIFFRLKNKINNKKYIYRLSKIFQNFALYGDQLNPLFYSCNIVNLCYLIYYLSYQLNKNISFESEDLSQIQDKFALLLDIFFKEMPRKTLQYYLKHMDLLGNRFYDYYFVQNLPLNIDAKALEKLIDYFWDQKIEMSHKFLYSQNMKLFYQQIPFSFSYLKEIQILENPKKKYYKFKFKVFIKRIKFFVINQIINHVIFLAFEIADIYFLSNVMLENKQDNDLAIQMYFEQNKVFIIFVIITRISFLLNVLEEVKSKKKLDFNSALYILLIILALLYLFLLSKNDYLVVKTLMLNLNLPLVLFIVYQIVQLFTAFPETGFEMKMFLNLLKILFIYAFSTFFSILGFQFVFFSLFQQYVATENFSQDFYIGVLYMYEFVFGSIFYLKQKELLSQEMYFNTFLVFVSWFGNVMIISFLGTYLIEKFNYIRENILYLILRQQYGAIKTYQRLEKKYSAYNLLYINLLTLLFFLIKKFYRSFKMDRAVQKINHFVILLPYSTILFLISNFFQFFKLYFMMYVKIYKRFSFKTSKFLCNFIIWFMFGPLILIYLEIIDYIQLLQCIFDYSDFQSQRDKEFKIKYFYKLLDIQTFLDDNYFQQKTSVKTFFEKLLNFEHQQKSIKRIKTFFDDQEQNQVQHHEFELTISDQELYDKFIKCFSYYDQDLQTQMLRVNFVRKFLKKHLYYNNINLIMSYNFDRTRDCMIKALINDEKFVKQYMDKLGETIDEIDKEIQRLIDINNNQIQMEDLKVKFELLQLEKKLQEIQNTLDCLSTFNHKLSYNAFAPLNSVLLVEGKFVNTNNIHVKSDEYVLEMSQNDAINFIKQKKQSILKSI